MRTILIIWILLLSFFSQAQTTIYMRAGAGACWFRGANVKLDKQYKPSLSFGYGLQKSIAKNIALNIELDYINKGDYYRNDTSKREIAANYLELPLLIKFYTPESKVRSFITIGCAYGLLLFANDSYIDENPTDPNLKFIKYPKKTTALSGNEFSLMFSHGIQIKSIAIELRYSAGLSKVVFGAKNTSASLNISYLF